MRCTNRLNPRNNTGIHNVPPRFHRSRGAINIIYKTSCASRGCYATVALSLNSMGPTRTSSRGSRRVRSACHEPDTHDDPRRLVRHARFSSRGSSRGCPLGMRACTHVRVYCTRLQNYTIGASIKSVSVSVPWNSSYTLVQYQLYEAFLRQITTTSLQFLGNAAMCRWQYFNDYYFAPQRVR